MAEDLAAGPEKVIHADPTKDFFVKMITRDIALQDCIFDLLDNAIDGARRNNETETEQPLAGYFAEVSFNNAQFRITDNCGGIRLTDAIDHAFHFGKRPNSSSDISGGIGLYGIGMKRAIFKIGQMVEVISDAEDACFRVSVNVPEWEQKPEWDFEYEDFTRGEVRGTSILVTNLNPGIDLAFGDPVFLNELIRLIARDYAFFIAKGFRIQVNGQNVPSYSYQLRSNTNLKPASLSYQDNGVNIRIVAGVIDDLPDEIPEELSTKDTERYGWYIVCNDRIVLAADKTEATIWGDNGFRMWHPQYNGFAGFVFFHADDQRILPWTTTKRAVDSSSPLYRRTLNRLKELTAQFISYTNHRKNDLAAAKAAERPQEQINVYEPVQAEPEIRPMELPNLATDTSADPLVNVAYKRTVSELNEIRRHLGMKSMSNREIGIRTFEYFREVELGK
ncbi:ATP-binding protein [Chitinibacteraceae bacterium HSL-7]